VPSSANTSHRTVLTIHCRFQFSSTLKCMLTVSSLPGGKTIVAVKGAPETIKGMLRVCLEWYHEMYKWYARRGSWVLALGVKGMAMVCIFVFGDFWWCVRLIVVVGGRSISCQESRWRVIWCLLDSWFSIVRSRRML